MEELLLCGARFLILDGLGAEMLPLAKAWLGKCHDSGHLTTSHGNSPLRPLDETWPLIFGAPADAMVRRYWERVAGAADANGGPEQREKGVLLATPGDLVWSVYGNIHAKLNPRASLGLTDELVDRTPYLKMRCTPGVVTNVSRIFASLAAKSALLLQGPPGVGKTAVVCAVARVLGVEVERINFSANTSLEQLFGSTMPLIDKKGNRIFKWCNGVLLDGLYAGRWLLFDEINLASAEVLRRSIRIWPLLAGVSWPHHQREFSSMPIAGPREPRAAPSFHDYFFSDPREGVRLEAG